MNLSMPIGFLCGGLVLFFGVFHEMDNSNVLISAHAFIIVVGGTMTAALICFPLKHFFNMLKVLITAVLGTRHGPILRTINEIVELSLNLNNGSSIAELIPRVRNPFLKESLKLMESGGLSDQELFEVLEKRIEVQNEMYQRDSATFRTIGKFPPAFGLIGTSVGMISLLQGLGSPDAFSKIGPAMSLALVATFYGLVFSNFILIPIGENLNHACESDLLIRRLVIDGIRLLRNGTHPLLVNEHLRSYLAPAQRNKMKKVA